MNDTGLQIQMDRGIYININEAVMFNNILIDIHDGMSGEAWFELDVNGVDHPEAGVVLLEENTTGLFEVCASTIIRTTVDTNIGVKAKNAQCNVAYSSITIVMLI